MRATSQAIKDLMFVAGALVCPVCDSVTRSDFCPNCLAPLTAAAKQLDADEDRRCRESLRAMGVQVRMWCGIAVLAVLFACRPGVPDTTPIVPCVVSGTLTPWDAQAEYHKGNKVIFEGDLYECTAARSTSSVPSDEIDWRLLGHCEVRP